MEQKQTATRDSGSLDALVMRQRRAQKERKEKRKDEAWADLGDTLRDMARGDDLGPLGQTGWNE